MRKMQTTSSKTMLKALVIACRVSDISMAVIAGNVGNEAEAVKRNGADDGRPWTWRSRAQGGVAAL